MFGESDSESPRAPSPWDSLTSAPPSPPQHSGVPKLVPEAEEGNIEYKLQLLSPTPARFARLVTQLKWRLLEGGGQAYYELGVADSGTLVGLPRRQLEESLETLEMMAGEIGASVIVVKEIEVPPELSTLAESQLERWDGKRSTGRKDRLRIMKQDDESLTTSAPEVETESTTDVTDAGEYACHSPTTPPSSPPAESYLPLIKSPTAPLPFDPVLAMFTMDLGDDVANDADNEALDDDVDGSADCVTEFFINLEISTVYKPRPMKKRVTHHIAHLKHTKKKLKNGHPSSKSSHTTSQVPEPTVQDISAVLLQPTGAKAQLRRDKRDKRREVMHSTPTVPPAESTERRPIPPSSEDEPSSCAPESPPAIAIDPSTADESRTAAIAPKEPRLIVEALVVRKLSLNEVFLDFEGFSLQ